MEKAKVSENIENRIKIIKIISAIVALGQLALSQIHIGVITKVFESKTGIYLFAFTLFCLVGLFMATRVSSSSDAIKHLIINVIAIAAAIIYLSLLNGDVQTKDFVTFEVVRNSVYLIGFSTVLLLIESILLCTIYKKI